MKTVEWVVGQIIHHGRVKRGYLGMFGFARPVPGGPAERAGLRRGDWLLAAGGDSKVGTMDDLYRVVAQKPPQSPVLVTVLRDGSKVLEIHVVVADEMDRPQP